MYLVLRAISIFLYRICNVTLNLIPKKSWINILTRSLPNNFSSAIIRLCVTDLYEFLRHIYFFDIVISGDRDSEKHSSKEIFSFRVFSSKVDNNATRGNFMTLECINKSHGASANFKLARIMKWNYSVYNL